MTETEIRGAQARLKRLLDEHGLLLHHAPKLPSATTCIAGEPIRGSWWGHPKGKLIYETLLRASPAVAWAKLVLGKETMVHERLWPALLAAAESGQDWQLRGLKPDAQRLLRRIRDAAAPVQADERSAPPGSRKVAVIARELERRLLAHSYNEHMPDGHHARFLETWGVWAEKRGVRKADRPGVAAAIEALSAPVLEWTGGAKPRGLLPWLDGG